MFSRYLLAGLLAAAPLGTALAQTTGAVGIGTTAPDASAALDIVSSNKGLLLPRVASAAAISNPAPGLLVYQTGVPAGFYYNGGTAAAPSWQQLATAGSGDNLGNHTATQSLQLNGNTLSNNGTGGISLDNGGNAGVGVTSPAQKLDVDGGILVRASGPVSNQGAYLQWNRTGGDGETWLLNQRGLGGSNAGIRFGGVTTGNAVSEWARILDNGNVGIGTTAPGQKLEVAGQIYSNTGGFRFPDGTVQTTAAAAGGDNLGNHTATQNLDLGTNQLVGNGGSQGLGITNGGFVGISASNPISRLANTGINSVSSDNSGAGPNGLTWRVDQSAYAGMFVNGNASGRGLAVKVAAAGTTPAFNVSQGNTTAAGTSLLTVQANGTVNVGTLAGTGTRVVTTDANGNLGATSALESLLRMQKGTLTVGPGAADATKTVTITFPTPFATVPIVTISTSNEDGTNYDDTFAATIRGVSTTQCVVNIRRVDQTGLWGQQLRLNWIAIP